MPEASGEDPRIAAFFAREAPWRAELNALRDVLLPCPVTEGFKWRGPVYMAGTAPGGGNVATLWRMKESCGLSFFKGVLLPDPARILEAPGANSRSVRYARFTATDQIAPLADILRAYVEEAVRNELAGRRVEMPKDDLDMPEEMLAAFEADPELQQAFEGLTPGRRRGWILHVGGAKQSATRSARLDKARSRILAGKGMHDR